MPRLRVAHLTFCGLFLGCVHTAPPPAPPASAPPPPPAAQPPALPEAPATPPQPAAAEAAPAPVSPTAPRPIVSRRPRDPQLLGLGCRATRSDLDSCGARGKDCRLEAPPTKNPCRNRGARCLDREARPAADPTCHCYCGQEYSRAYRLLNPRPSHRSGCRTLVNLKTGRNETICDRRPPQLPQ